MKKGWHIVLSLIFLLVMASCGDNPEPTPMATDAPSTVPTEDTTPSSPLPTPMAPGEQSPIPTPTTGAAEDYTPPPDSGAVRGELLRGDPPVPFGRGILYLGSVVTQGDGVPVMASLNKATAPSAGLGPSGEFLFTEVPEGRYALVLDVIASTVILRNPDDGSDLLIEVEAGQVVDLGELVYSDMPPSP